MLISLQADESAVGASAFFPFIQVHSTTYNMNIGHFNVYGHVFLDRWRSVVGLLAILFIPNANAVVIDFEGLPDSTSLTNQYAPQGITFSNATVLTAGFSLNEFEFPPLSGENVIFNDGGFIIGTFSSLITSLSVNVTYAGPVTLVAFDLSNTPVASVTSLFSQNFVSSGNPANELLSLSVPAGIASFELQGASAGATLVADNVTFLSSVLTVPEVGSTFSFLASAAGSLLMLHAAGLRRLRACRALSHHDRWCESPLTSTLPLP